MIHLNSRIDEIADVRPDLSWAHRTFLPEMYSASSLGDFYHNRNDVLPTRRSFFSFGVIYNGCSYIFVNSGGFLQTRAAASIELSDQSHLTFPAVAVGPARKNLPLPSSDPLRVYSLTLCYLPKKDQVFLQDFSLHGPEAPQEVRKSLLDFLKPKLRLSLK